VCATVTSVSQVKGLPRCHGISVKSTGFLVTATPVDANTFATTSFTVWCLAYALLLFFIHSGVKIPSVKSKVKSKRKLKWSLLVARETVVEQDGVKALNSYRNALEKKAGLSVVS